MGFTPEQLAALERRLATGTASAAYQDRRVTHRSLDEMLALRREIRRELGLDAGREHFVRTQFSKGL